METIRNEILTQEQVSKLDLADSGWFLERFPLAPENLTLALALVLALVWALAWVLALVWAWVWAPGPAPGRDFQVLAVSDVCNEIL